MKYIVLLILLFAGPNCISQNDESKVDALILEFSEKLKERQITSFFYSKQYCVGETVMFKNDDGSMCFSNGTYYEVYFFWKEEDRVMIKKIDNCGMYFSLPVENDLVYDSFIENVDQLKSEKVKRYAVENPENVPVQRSDVFPCFRKYSFTSESESFDQEYNLFDLTSNSKFENIHYDYNKSLRIVDIDKIIEALVVNMEPSFRRQMK